jgi:peptidoglycan lytic transglycosylase D
MELRALLVAISSAIVLAGCQSLPQDTTSTETAEAAAVTAGTVIDEAPQKLDPVPAPPADLWGRMRSQMTLTDVNHSEVAKARSHFLKQHNYMGVVAGRGSLFLHYILGEVEKRGMPAEIALLPMVESGFDPFARSSQDAAGLWQIMPSTGKYLGLQSNWWYDGRRDLQASTDAALDYLEKMNRDFDGDWLLSLAAYNSGKGRVMRAQRANEKTGKSTDFWSLKLPRETRSYVPRLLALADIVAHPERYDVELPHIANEAVFEPVNTDGQIELRRAAELAGIPLLDLRMLNAGQRRWATSPEQANELLVPIMAADRFNNKLASLPRDERVSWQHYRIERGDSLIKIAKKFDTQVELIRQANSIKGSRIRAGDRLMIPSGGDWADSLAQAGETERRATGYRVRQGDSLYRIAGRFNVSISEIVAWNSLDPGKYLQPGQKLTLYVRGG